MKAGIITCHDVFNYGSSLQAYALSTWLREQQVGAEIIDYKPDYMYRLVDFMEVDAPRWQKTVLHRWAYRIRLLPYRLGLVPKYLRYRRFNRRYLPLTGKRYTTLNALKELDEYDILICGSDQIWCSLKEKCGSDPAFYLAFSEGVKKIAYAASFGAAQVSATGECCVRQYLPDFHAISVRESSGVELLGQLGITAQQVLDPVFLLPKERWAAMERKPNGLPDDYILLYGYDNALDMVSLKERLEREHRCPVISLRMPEKFSRYGPEEFLYMVRHARLVVTSSFHAIAFSLLFETPFAAILTGNRELFERLESILRLTGTEGRIWNGDMKAQLPDIDFLFARHRLCTARAESEAFLKEALYG